MRCYDCKLPASAKIGTARASILNALFPFLGGKSWEKYEIYVCRKHHLERLKARK